MKKVVSVLLCLLLTLSAFSVASADAIEISFWHSFTGSDGAMQEELANMFNASQDEIRVTVQAIKRDDYWNKIIAGAVSGDLPHIGSLHLNDVPRFSELGVFRNFDEAAEILGFTADDYPPNYWESSYYKGSRWGMPLDIHPIGIWYNKDILEANGIDPSTLTTGEAFVEAAVKCNDSENGVWGVGVPINSVDIWRDVWYTLFIQYGGTELSEDGKTCTINTEAGVKATKWLKDLIFEYEVSPQNLEYRGDTNLFSAGQAAFFFQPALAILGFQENESLNAGFLAFPQVGDQNDLCWAASHQLGITTRDMTDEEYQAAIAYMKFIAENAIVWAKAGQLPPLNAVRESEEFAAMEIQSTAASMLDRLALLTADYPWYTTGFSYAFYEPLSGTLAGTQDIQEGLGAAVEYVNQNIESICDTYGW